MSVPVRRARAEDLAAMVAIERACFPDPWSEASFRELVDARHARVVVAEGSSVPVVGYSVLLLAGSEGDLANLAVAPEARRSGVGRALLHDALDGARAAGVREVYLEVRDSNAAALGLYAAAGFEEVGRRRGYYRQPREDARVLRLVLMPVQPAR